MRSANQRRFTHTALFVSYLFVTSAPAAHAGDVPAAGGAMLNVPYLSQTEALCGGAAAAMLFRYWGDRHADVQQFAPLVDRRAGGIADTVLIDAIQERHWVARRIDGTVQSLRDHLAAGQPPMLLIEDRPGRYHFVVAVGADNESVYLHDPAWGPARRLTVPQLLRRWKPSGYWMLLVLPDGSRPTIDPATARQGDSSAAPAREKTACGRLLDSALDEISARGLGAADEALGAVRQQCPASSAPISELAGIRVVQKRVSEAVSLAEAALRIDASDRYAWDVLGSSRFLQNDAHGALRAWGHIGKPTLDSVHIDGLTHTRYSLLAQALTLQPNTVLSDDDFTMAERRLQQLPDRLAARIAVRPESDGFAIVDVAIVERPLHPRGPVEWAAFGVQTAVDREITANIPGRTGQGELWTASYRWWADRPRAAVSFAAPRLGVLPGVWRVNGSSEAQTYSFNGQPSIRETRAHGDLTIADWLTPNIRYSAVVGLDSWDHARRAISMGATLERRLFGDRISVSGSAANWIAPSTSTGPGFRTGSLRAAFTSSHEPSGVVATAEAGIDHASESAPLSLWSGAGEGRARPHLLRAHPLLDGGVISGEVFGRTLEYATVEAQRWFARPSLVRVAIAAFADAAAASPHRQVDAGLGLRMRVPGEEGTLRVDYARGLRDGANAVTVGWQIW